MPKSKGQFGTDFGFSKTVSEQNKVTPLDTAFSSWQQKKTPESMQELLKASDSVIGKALTSYAGGDKSLKPYAKRLAIGAFRKFDPRMQTKLQTHLFIQLQPLQREYMKRTSTVKIPERIQLDKYRLDMADRELREMTGRDPSDDELSEKTGLSPKRMMRVREFSKGLISESQTETAEEGVKLPGSESVSPEDIWIEYVHHDLDPVDKKILEWKTGLYGKEILSTNEIARRLKVTPGAVSQRAAKIATRIEEGLKGG